MIQTIVSEFYSNIAQLCFTFLQRQVQRLFLQSSLFIVFVLQLKHLVGDTQVFGLAFSPGNVQLQGVLSGQLHTFCSIQRVCQLFIRLQSVICLFKTIERLVSSCHIGQSVYWYTYELGSLQSFFRFFVQSVVIVVNNAVHTYITTSFLSELLKLMIVLVESLQIYLIIRLVRIGDTDVGECQLAM